MQTDALIRTKLQPPTIGPDILPRPQLIDRLENGRYRKLTLISAPAGYGKSILASLWQEACSCQGVWLTLDNNDNELALFLSYFINAIQTIYPDAFPETEAQLNGLHVPTLDIISTSLTNEISVVSQPFIFVLDDYHVITSHSINQFISTLIQYLPAQMHLVLTCRQDPQLDLINCRARNQVTEIRLAELRFRKEETTRYIESKLGENVPPDLVHKLFQYTEGWAAGLRLAVLAWHSYTDQALFLKTFQGTNQYVMSYLLSEVLSQQSQPVQTFLLHTSLLDRFCVPLCDALLGAENLEESSSQTILDTVLQDNLFLIPLDNQGEWYRYHHLFRDLLRHQLRSTVTATKIKHIHIRASSWLVSQGLVEEALDHAFFADDMPLAANIIARARTDLMNNARWHRLERLLRRFPADIVDQYIDLLMAETWLFYHHTQYTKLPTALARLEKAINRTSMPSDEKNRLLGEICALRSLLAYFAVDVGGAISYAEKALKHTSPELWIVRVLARMMLAGAHQLSGNLQQAYATIYTNFDDEPIQINALKATTLATVCNIQWMDADLVGLQQSAAQVIQLSQNAHSQEILGLGRYHAGTAAYHQNDLAAAEEHYSFVNQRPFRNYGHSFAYCACGLALTYQARGQEQEARDVVDAALAYLLMTGNTQLLFVMKAFQAQLSLQQGQLTMASQWAARLDPIPPLSPITLMYAPHMTVVKVWLAENTSASLAKASGLLTQLRDFVEFTHNTNFLIETLSLQAMRDQLSGDESNALTTLEQALTLALPGNFIRRFVDLGQVMGNLLFKLSPKVSELAAYQGKILAAFTPSTSQQGPYLQDDNGSQPLVEPLTDREMDVLLLLGQRLSDKEIAENLVISPSTVRSHTKNIYSKLDVNNRRQAVVRAQELRLLSPQ